VHEDPIDPHELKVERSSEGDVHVVRAAGELDASSAERLRDALDEIFTEGHSSVVIDLEHISFIDSSGLSVLIYGYKQAVERDGTLTLRAPSAAVIRLLDLTGQRRRFLGPDA
jgi:anti-anti-sigma factor